MSDVLEVYTAAYRDEESRHGVFSHFEPGTRTLPAGFQVKPGFMPTPVDIVFDKDVAVTLRDGTTIYTDILRPAGAEKVPVIVAWSPYGKSRGNAAQYVQLFGLLGMDIATLSGLNKFEGPDPAFWCAQGYAVCNPDPRGAYHSEGDIRVWSKQEGEDYYDLVEWLGVQDWCNGKVGTTGNSYLAISQWFVAAEQPPHLAAIAPWEGMSDIYRDLVVRGGIPDFPFPRILETSLVGQNLREDLVAEAEQHPLVDTLWESKIPAFENITVPASIVASYSNSIHTPGTFRGWRGIASAEKWLRIHNTMEWPDYYEPANLDDLLRFFDRYLKGVDNDWEQTPRVRYALMDLEGGDRINQPADAFPPSDFSSVRYYLDPASQTLTRQAPAVSGSVEYDGRSEAGRATFTMRLDEETEFVGYPTVRVWVATETGDDMDVFVFLQKLNADGEPLEQFTVHGRGPQIEAVTKNGAAILKYKGSNGRLRASMRHLDGAKTTDSIPVHSFDRVEKLSPGEIVCLDIDMFPVGLAFHPGEQLRLIVTGHHILGGVMPGTANVTASNHGDHIVHTGGDHASYLQLPTKVRSPSAGR